MPLLYDILYLRQTKKSSQKFFVSKGVFLVSPPKKTEQHHRVRRSPLEGLVTFLMFPVLVGLAFAADKGGKLP